MTKRSRIAAVLVITLVLLPLLSIPFWLVGGRIADALDNDDSNGVLALDLILGVGGPGLLAIAVAYHRVKTPIAVALGIVTGGISLVVLFVAFLIYCDDCIV
jgi:hypothetical protein